MASQEREDLIRLDLLGHAPAANLMLSEKIKELLGSGRTVYHLAFGQSPFTVLESALESLALNACKTAYLPVAGILELRKAICEFHREFDALDLEPGNIIVGPGSKQLIFLLLRIFNGDVFVLSPSWITYRPQARLAGHEPIVISTEYRHKWRLTPDILDRALKKSSAKNKLLILANPDNPTGTVYSEGHWKDLVGVLRNHKVIVLSDEIYGRLTFSGNHCSLAKCYPEGTILSTGLSKWASAGGWRVGYHAYPPALRSLLNAVTNAASNTHTCAAAPMQYAAVSYLSASEETKAFTFHLQRILEAVADYCHSHLAEVGVKAVKPLGGFYMFPDFEAIRCALAKRGITTAQQMCDTLFEEVSVALMPGGPSFLRPLEELTVRLCFVNFDGHGALKASEAVGFNNPLPGDFVEKYCKLTAEGIQALKKWVVTQKNSVS
ncbi:aspartate aminotransferase-like isoform X1 [Montipora foliosa]|uniref:aspartate aminotransferase-like isoform X1 n=1 Tax=Montipora foliosa TaxID=591990 RepID=UPI0035F1A2D5